MAGPGGVAADQLKAFVERIERLEEEKKTIADDIRQVYAEAKGTGYDVTILKQVIKIRKQDKSEREEHEAILELYLSALGIVRSADEDDADDDAPLIRAIKDATPAAETHA